MTSRRRPCSAEGRLAGAGSSGREVEMPLSGDEGVDEGGCEGSEIAEEKGGFEDSAKCRRACVRILHCKQIFGLSDGRLRILSGCLAADKAIESKTSRGVSRASDCMAGLPSRDLGGDDVVLMPSKLFGSSGLGRCGRMPGSSIRPLHPI